MAECAGFENQCGVTPTGGSNPPLSATFPAAHDRAAAGAAALRRVGRGTKLVTKLVRKGGRALPPAVDTGSCQLGSPGRAHSRSPAPFCPRGDS